MIDLVDAVNNLAMVILAGLLIQIALWIDEITDNHWGFGFAVAVASVGVGFLVSAIYALTARWYPLG